VLYRFSQSSSGLAYAYGGVNFDAAGNLYGTSTFGGDLNYCNNQGCGAIYELSPSGGSWNFNLLYSCTSFDGCAFPMGTMVTDHAGNLYGTTFYGGVGWGNVFELVKSASGWSMDSLYAFQNNNDGGMPQAGVIFDAAGNLYGATTNLSLEEPGGVAFELTRSGSGWTYNILHSYPGSFGIYGNLTFDSAGNLYGTTLISSSNGGTVFKLSDNGGQWTSTDLYEWSSRDPGEPECNVVIGPDGTLYGTTTAGGTGGYGVVWEITP
jgi:hypothetical protein